MSGKSMSGRTRIPLIYNMVSSKGTSNRIKGFTLVELMIALALSGFLLLGVVGTYTSIQGTITASKELENSQEVIRYSAHVFTRSLKQTQTAAVVSSTLADPQANPPVPPGVNNVLTVTLPPLSTSCLGRDLVLGSFEVYTFDQVSKTLSCKVGLTPAIDLLMDIESLGFIENADRTMVTVQVYPANLQNNNNFPEPIDINIALTSVILAAAL